MSVTNEVRGPIKMTAQADSFTRRVKISYIRWVGATTAGHTLVVNDGNGDLIWDAEADGANFNDLMPIFDFREGLSLTTMQSGHVLVYIM